jgi:hypothetical protein
LRASFIVSFAAASLLATYGLAQTTSASISGRVAFADGTAAPGSLVQAREAETGGSRQAVADAAGRYRIDPIPPGTWSVVARSADGVLSDTRTITLRLQQAGIVDLVVGAGLTEDVTVRAEAPLFDPRRTGGELRIGGAQVQELPVPAAGVTDLALLDAAVRPAAPAAYYGERSPPFVVNGQSGRANTYLVDGLDNNDTASGTSLNASFSDLVIDEFVVLTHQFSPEFGRASGGVMNILTQRGTNTPSSLGFLQGSFDSWNASGGLVSSLPDSGTAEASSRFAAGFRSGGPIRKDKAFWFGAFEHAGDATVVPFTGTTRDGTFGGRYEADNRDDNLFLRGDVNLDPSNTLMVRLSYDDRVTSALNVGGVTTPEFGFTLAERDAQLGASLTSVIRPNLIHELRLLAGTSSMEQDANSSRPGVERPSGQFGGNNLNRQVRDATQLQVLGNLTWLEAAHTMKFGYDVVKSRTTIDARFNPNGNFIYRTDVAFEPGDCGGIVFSDLPLRCSEDPSQTCILENDQCPALGKGTCKPNYDLPVPCPGAEGVDDDGDGNIDEDALPSTYPLVYQLIQGNPKAALNDVQLALFAQDSWQASPRLVLDFGLRYDVSTFTLPASAAVDSVVPNGGAPRDTNNLAPRVGFAYTLGTKRGFVVRGGAGVFYNKSVLAFPAVAAITSETAIGLIFVQGFLFEEITEDEIEANGTGLAEDLLQFLEPLTLRFSTGTRMDATQANLFNLGFEKAFGEHGAFSVNGTRALTYHVPVMKDLNPVAGVSLIGAPIHKYDDQVGSIAAVVTEGRAWYWGLDLGWKWQSARGWHSATYTLSRSEDMGPDPLKGGIYLPQDPEDLDSERGRADHDRRHRLVLAGDTALPWLGLRISGIYQWATAIPYNVTTGADDNLDGITTDRPSGVGRNTGEDTPAGAVNGYRALHGLGPVDVPSSPDLSQLDLRIYRPFTFHGGKGTGQAFVQVFNVLNRFNGGLVEGRALARNFGEVITAAGPPRTIELGVKIGF